MEYHKIQTVFKRDPDTKFKTLLEGEYSLPEFEYLKDNEWVFTEKVDGTNIRVTHNGFGGIKFGGRTERSNIPALLVNRLNELFPPETMKNVFGEDVVCLYGEGFGSGIQKAGKAYADEQSFVLFDVKIGDWWLKREDVDDIANSLSIQSVPIMGRGDLIKMVTLVKNGFLSYWGGFMAEGLVARPAIELQTRGGERIITKIKHKDFPSS